MIAAVLMVLTGCLRNVEAAYKTINWGKHRTDRGDAADVRRAGKTGASELLSRQLAQGLGSYGPVVLLAGVYFTTSLMTMFISNTATAVLLAPVALHAAVEIGASPSVPVRGRGGSEHVFRLAVLYAA